MTLMPVRNYEGARYPTLAEHLARRRGRILSSVALGAALAIVAVLLSGCTISS